MPVERGAKQSAGSFVLQEELTRMFRTDTTAGAATREGRAVVRIIGDLSDDVLVFPRNIQKAASPATEAGRRELKIRNLSAMRRTLASIVPETDDHTLTKSYSRVMLELERSVDRLVLENKLAKRNPPRPRFNFGGASGLKAD